MKKLIFVILTLFIAFVSIDNVKAVDASNADNVTCTYGTPGANTAFDIYYDKKKDLIEIKDRYASVDDKARLFMKNNKNNYTKLFKNGNSLQCSQEIKCNCPSVGKCQVWIGNTGYEYTYIPELQTSVLTSELDNECQLKSTVFGVDSSSVSYDKSCTFTAKDSVHTNEQYTLFFQYDSKNKAVSPIKITSSKYKNAKYEGNGSSTIKKFHLLIYIFQELLLIVLLNLILEVMVALKHI